MTNPLLSGIRILDLSRLLPGPFCTAYLAQLGAEVIKIEEPGGGDYARAMSPAMFELVNGGKRSVTLDLRKPEGQAVFLKLAEQADVVLETFRPGVMDKLGCGYAQLRQRNPRLVYVAISGYGATGPYRERAGHDINYLGYAGVLDQIGRAGQPPALSNVQIADLAAGALTAALGLLAAVLGAKTSGQGACLDLSMTDAAFSLQVLSLAAIRQDGAAAERGRDMLSGGLANYDVYRCADGRYMAVGALEPKFWNALKQALDRPDWPSIPPPAGTQSEQLRSELAAIFATQDRDHWERHFAAYDACVSAVLTPDEALDNAQLQARGMVASRDGKPIAGSPFCFLDAQTAAPAAAPALGAQADEVLAAAGYDETARADLRRRGVI